MLGGFKDIVFILCFKSVRALLTVVKGKGAKLLSALPQRRMKLTYAVEVC